MFKALIAALGLAVSVNAVAAPTVSEALVQVQLPAIMEQAQTQGLDWKVGDQANYELNMGFIKGTMVMSVASIVAEGIWMNQDLDLGFAGKQKMETLLDPNTGEIKKMLVNGKEQEVPKQDVEVLEMKEDRITVPAGTFDCIHARIKDKTQNQEVNAWMNPGLVPMSGMIKQVAPSQLGQVTISLKSFKKN